jgi:hypothetical protein
MSALYWFLAATWAASNSKPNGLLTAPLSPRCQFSFMPNYTRCKIEN